MTRAYMQAHQWRCITVLVSGMFAAVVLGGAIGQGLLHHVLGAPEPYPSTVTITLNLAGLFGWKAWCMRHFTRKALEASHATPK